MKNSRGVVVVMCRLALFGALSVGCVAHAEPTAAEREALLDGCSKDSQCEDGNPCTQNLCAIGICAPALPVLGCCYEGDCTSPDVEGAIAPIIELAPSGCSEHEDCEDGHPCTQNLCVAGECAALPVLGCCLDGDCDLGLGGSSGGGSTSGGSNGAGESSTAGAMSGGGASSAGGASTNGGSGPSTGGSGAATPGGSSAIGGSGATDAGRDSSESGTAGAVSAGADVDYQLQGGGCMVDYKRRSSSYAATWLGALLAASGWLRARRRASSTTASLRHS